jgi:hypothetical protein
VLVAEMRRLLPCVAQHDAQTIGELQGIHGAKQQAGFERCTAATIENSLWSPPGTHKPASGLDPNQSDVTNRGFLALSAGGHGGRWIQNCSVVLSYSRCVGIS